MKNVGEEEEWKGREVKVNQNVMWTNLNGWKVLLKMCIYMMGK